MPAEFDASRVVHVETGFDEASSESTTDGAHWATVVRDDGRTGSGRASSREYAIAIAARRSLKA